MQDLEVLEVVVFLFFLGAGLCFLALDLEGDFGEFEEMVELEGFFVFLDSRFSFGKEVEDDEVVVGESEKVEEFDVNFVSNTACNLGGRVTELAIAFRSSVRNFPCVVKLKFQCTRFKSS